MKIQKYIFNRTFWSRFLFIELLYLFFLCFMLFSTQQATDKNTYFIEPNISDIYIDEIPNRYDNIYLISGDKKYVVGWSKEAKNEFALLKKAISDNRTVRLQVLKNDGIMSTYRLGKLVCVNIQIDNDIIFDIRDYNHNQKTDRASGFVGFVVLGIFCQVVVVYLFFFGKNSKKKSIKRRFRTIRGRLETTGTNQDKTGDGSVIEP